MKKIVLTMTILLAVLLVSCGADGTESGDQIPLSERGGTYEAPWNGDIVVPPVTEGKLIIIINGEDGSISIQSTFNVPHIFGPVTGTPFTSEQLEDKGFTFTLVASQGGFKLSGKILFDKKDYNKLTFTAAEDNNIFKDENVFILTKQP